LTDFDIYLVQLEVLYPAIESI